MYSNLLISPLTKSHDTPNADVEFYIRVSPEA